jgi:hypothetical protein
MTKSETTTDTPADTADLGTVVGPPTIEGKTGVYNQETGEFTIK